MLLDEDGLFIRLNCAENLYVFADIYGIPSNKALEALKNVGLQDAAKKSAAKLSRGMRQRLALARAILHEPKLLFLDEPTSGLDPATARGIHKLILGLRERGATVFLTTHNMEEAVMLCDHVALLHKGHIIEQGAPAEICALRGRENRTRFGIGVYQINGGGIGMRSARTIFRKQALDVLKNPIVLVQFLIFPVVAFVMTELVAKPNDDIPNNMFICLMAAIFAGMGLIPAAAGVIVEDIERKSLRFLVMAGVKPHEYMLGTGGFLLLAGAAVSLVFALLGDWMGTEFVKFLAVMTAGVAASVMLGAAIGMLSKNHQAAIAIAMPVAIILGFTPMIAGFNATVAKAAGILYTQQLNVVVNDFSANFTKAIAVMGADIAVLVLLFTLAYRKNGLKG